MNPRTKHILHWMAITVALAALLWFYGRIQRRSYAPTLAEPDTQAYLFLADRMARGLPLEVDDFDPFRFQHHMWVENHRGLITTKFAPGLPLIMAAAQRVAGPEAVFWVNPVMGGLALLGTFALCRRWMGDIAALAAAASIAFNPLFEFHAGYTLTHVAEMCLTVWGAYFLWRWVDAERPGPASPSAPAPTATDTAAATNLLPRTPWRDVALGVAAGLLLGYAASIRYTSALLVLPMLATIGFRLWGNRAAPRASLLSAGAMLAAYALTPTGLMFYNHRLFGSPFRTGYSLSGEQGAFGWSHLIEAHRILFLGLYDLAPVVLGLAAAGLLVAGRPRDRLMRAIFILPLYALYASYYWAPNNSSYYRFLICVMPFMAGCAFACIDQSTSRWRGVAALALAGLVAYQHWPGLSQQLEGNTFTHGWVAGAVRKAQVETPAHTVLFVSDELSYHLAAVADQRVYSMGAFRPGRAWWPYREKWAPRMQPIRKNQMEELYKSVNGEWLIAKRNRMITGFLAAGRPVAFVVPANDAEGVKRTLDLDLATSVRDTWTAVEDQKWVILEVKRR